MRFATEQGIRHLHLNTNGIRLRPEIAEQILEAGVRSFNISVDGPNGLTHDRIRGRLGSFDTTMRHLNYLLERRDAYDLKLRMNFTVMRDNVRLLPQMAQLAQELKVRLYLNLATDTTFLFRADQVSDIKRVDAGDIDSALTELEQMLRTDPKWLPRYSDLAYMRRHFSDLVQRDLPCAESQLKLMIHSRGEIGGCWGHDPTFNIRERTIREVIDSEEYQKEHARFFRKECVGCGSNYSLNLRWRPSSYREDALWRLGRRSLEQQ
jgi:MoaA/NifB/PqqE/SkfB family radical SAM enzyme